MPSRYPLWKTLTLVVLTVLAFLYASPNLFGEQPAVQVSAADGALPDADAQARLQAALAKAGVAPTQAGIEDGRWLARLPSADAQTRAAQALTQAMGEGYTVALNLVPRTPAWLRSLGARPMALGLDLRGGIYTLIEVATDDVLKTSLDRYLADIPASLRRADVRYLGRRLEARPGAGADGGTAQALVLPFADAATRDRARAVLGKDYQELTLANGTSAEGQPELLAFMNAQRVKDLTDQAIEQNLTTLRNRVNQLGVAEPLVARQGTNRIVVQLPGVQDATRVEDLLGATATLEYRAVAEGSDPVAAAAAGTPPPGTVLYYTRDGHRPVLLKDEVIVTGTNLIDASATYDAQSNRPAVSVTLDGPGAKAMYDFTKANVSKPMAVVFKETKISTRPGPDGKPVRTRRDVNDIISVANIQEPFGKRFQTTGLQQDEARKLAVLLKAGALAAPIEIVEQRTIGPSLGADNIRRGVTASLAGFVFVVLFMGFYYRVFGLFADIALFLNLVMLVACLSLIQATLTMPGIAGIILTLGIAVDGNVLINERIREELMRGTDPHTAIRQGYDRAFLTILDSNVTQLFGVLALLFLGSGPVKGFAVTLGIGIVISMLTSIVGTRALVYYIFERRPRLADLPV